MSKLTIPDLPRTQQLACSEMAKVSGGMTCQTQVDLAGSLGDLRDTLNNLGFYGAGNAVDDQIQDVLTQRCTV